MNTWRHTNDLTRLTSAVTTDLFLIRYDNMTPVIPDTFILIHLAAFYLATSSSSPLYVRVFHLCLPTSMFLPSYFCLMVLTLAIILIFISILPHGSHPGRRTHTPLHGSHHGNLQKASPSTCLASRFSTLANTNRSYFKDFSKYISLSLSLLQQLHDFVSSCSQQ